MKKCLAFVLGGGGSRGALQVGALRALLEAGFRPDLLVGTSIGAVNAVGLALWGMDETGLARLEGAYQNVVASRLMDPRLAQFIMDTLSWRANRRASRGIEGFLVGEGITPDLRFGQIDTVRLGFVSSDLNSGETVIYGKDPEQSVLEGLIASVALPLWFPAVEKEDRYMIDGGAFSNLPIEPALTLGATEIIALDLNDLGVLVGSENGHGSYLGKFLFAITRRQVSLEMELAAARNVPVRYVSLRSSPAVPIWDFRTHRDLFKVGYDTMQQQIAGWQPAGRPTWLSRLWPSSLKLPRSIAASFAKK